MSFGVKLILNIKKHHNLTILPKKSINFCKTQHISKKTQANPKKKPQANSKKTQANPKKTQCTGGKCLPDPPKSVKKKPGLPTVNRSGFLFRRSSGNQSKLIYRNLSILEIS